MNEQIRPRLSGNKRVAYENLTKKQSRVLVIGDLHEPFCLDGYLDHCQQTFAKHNCNQVVFIGDVIDNHYASYHETDTEALGGADELDLAIKRIKRWFQAFPKATVTIGNHDRIIMRKAQSSAVPRKWIKAYKDVLETPTWKFVDRIVIDGVQYVHGEGGTAHMKCRADMQSTVQGHLHTQCYTQFFVGQNFKVFGCQVGCGIDFDSYAMAYAKRGKKPAIACAVVIGGHTCINELMNL
jgi:predicted phosphodiesterase|tara:strand:+ start:1262 stop:1978 length:717 start_codon:yes stop_codon:yes gene_type:complete